jgi:hypothetical protein
MPLQRRPRIFLSFVTRVTVPPVAAVIGAGAVERVAMWAGLSWQIVTGIMLLAGTRCRPSPALAPAAASAFS